MSWTYELPFGRNMRGLSRAAIGGWQVNGIAVLQSGSPFTVTMLQNTLNTGTGVQWPNRIGSGELEHRTIDRWFDPATFVAPGNFNYGNSGRNILTGPGTKQFDLSLFKTFFFSENQTRRLQFRAEAFNAFNTPQFNNPDARIGSASLAVGKITSAGNPPLLQRTSREIQLALKLYF